MNPNALRTLLRIRQGCLDDAQQAVADALGHQQCMQQQSEDASSCYARETTAALDIAAGDDAVDTFARWLPIGRKAVAVARIAEHEATGGVDRARIVLGLARAAYRSVELLIEQHHGEAQLLQERTTQLAMDDIASRRCLS